MTAMPSTLPAISDARFPASYERAKAALAECASLDECKGWSDKAAALASYAKQAKDDTLERTARRIQGRAQRRAGELLKTFDGRGGDRTKSPDVLTFAPISQREAGDQAGMSRHQRVQAVAVANVPAPDFEAAIESETPPTISQLAMAGRKPRPAPAGFEHATKVKGTLSRFAEFCGVHDAAFVAGGFHPSEIAQLRRHVATIDAWLDAFVVNLKEV